MNIIQEKLLKIISHKNIGGFTLREIGVMVDEILPQKIKHHLSQLEKKGFILIDKKNKIIKRIDKDRRIDDFFTSVPIIGSANCGPANIYADENIEGYLKISKKFIPNKKGIFAIRAEGNSLNRANINHKSVKNGDFVIVDSNEKSPTDGDYVVSVIDGMANVKKYRLDKVNSRIVLLSESTKEYQPIFIHKNDDFKINGKVVDVVKNFKE